MDYCVIGSCFVGMLSFTDQSLLFYANMIISQPYLQKLDKINNTNNHVQSQIQRAMESYPQENKMQTYSQDVVPKFSPP